MQKSIFALAFTVSLSLLATPGFAGSHEGMGHSMNHSGHKMDHSGHSMPMKSNKAEAMGQLHKVHAHHNMVNLTHDPIPALGWPKMTMDLAVSKKVDLKLYKPGDRVHFTVKKGRDNQFRIIKMMKH
ncbi:copper-binding protein [Magnetococcus sp. PR-3]|uniref:copper-binding protein n=1 Tax=Magnetococcus sp. PR-3 TaxID=3120355 RepID=UPI002FCE1558